MVALQVHHSNPISRVAKYRRNHSQPASSKYMACISADDMDPGVTDTSYDPDSKVKSCKQKQKRLSDDEIRQIVDKYKAGATTYELAAEFGCHRRTISRALKKSGIEVSIKTESKDGVVATILHLYDDHMSALDIGKKLDIGEKTVRRILRENGVRIRHSSEY